MRHLILTSVALAAAFGSACANPNASAEAARSSAATTGTGAAQIGPRPYFLVDDLAASPLKDTLRACVRQRSNYSAREWSIGHRGAPLMFPEHTRESYVAAARMGAGIVECDVAFTKDKELVCRHAQNDLHTTTNILVTPLAAKCTQPFVPATLDATGNVVTPARAECRTSDITMAEFKTLKGKMDASNPAATTPEAYQGGTASFRTDLYAGPSSGKLMTHRESIELFKSLGVKMTPELKSPVVPMPFEGFTQEAYAQKLIDEYKAAGVSADRVFAQSFDVRDVRYWIAHEPAFGKQAVFLDDAETMADLPTLGELQAYKAEGINIVAPPIFALLTGDASGRIEPSQYARDAKAAGLDIIAWSLERSGCSPMAATASTTRASTRRSGAKATCCACSMRSTARSACARCSRTGRRPPPSTRTARTCAERGSARRPTPRAAPGARERGAPARRG